MRPLRNATLTLVIVSLLALATVPLAHSKELSEKSDPAELRAYIERINKLASPTADQLFNQANALCWLKDFDGAISASTKAIERSPSTSRYYVLRGAMYKSVDNDRAALNDLDVAEKLGFREPSLFGERMKVKLVLKDYQGAIADAEQRLLSDAKNTHALYVKGAAYCSLGELDKGIAILNRVIELDPNDANAFARRAAAYGMMGRLDKANSDLARMRSLEKKFQDSRGD